MARTVRKTVCLLIRLCQDDVVTSDRMAFGRAGLLDEILEGKITISIVTACQALHNDYRMS